jgi:hypothetical protein
VTGVQTCALPIYAFSACGRNDMSMNRYYVDTFLEGVHAVDMNESAWN